MSEANNKIATDAVGCILRIEQKSTLTTPEFWCALIKLAQNDAILRTALLRGSFSVYRGDPTEASKPIAIE